ncbi:hypothetical protein A3A20_00880 [Candidatus Wolfebacteria bacterium RIFCSPLOWO2_01_FULL_45_19]|uniref:HIT domain-containing protein n=1 Tax=Candidatus Wolfebacteria bacterium RIFCSPLOWO2_01_FULL_45_19 TaxID=1802557 RepID=A0A1F8DQF2_9BACT|nr:MAG: hypothetical protein A3A20_00880 [Candidatus Wolfebacteria bacterium RIFCSPLOWO2_01_FULL_45_19]
MMDCLFCKISRREISAEIIYEDNDTMAFLDINPRAPGHTVVIPKQHAENILELTAGAVEPLFLTVKKVTAMLKKAFEPDGFTIGINHGKASGQAVDHLHVHIFSRWRDDGGGSVHSVVDNPPKESLEEIALKLKN